MDLHGKVVVVTGASSGIGEATARAFADAGATVLAVARRAERLAALAATGSRIIPHVADVTDAAAVAALARRVETEQGACHVLVNNAGYTDRQGFRGIDDVDSVAAVLDVNLLGAVRCMGAFAPLLERSAPARVVNVASVAGKIGVGSPAYAASKFGLVGFSEAVRPDWARRGIAVTQLNPGFVHTEGFPQDRFAGSPLARLVAAPEDVARAILAAARSGAAERTVPRWYRALTIARHLAAPAVRGAARRFL